MSRNIETIYCYMDKCEKFVSFSPKEIKVYRVPSLDECMALLPRVIGNYILSFTNVWIEYYLENIKNKYGNKFIIEMIGDILLNKIYIRGHSKMNQENHANYLIYYLMNKSNIKRDLIPKAFEKLNLKIQRRKQILTYLRENIKVGNIIITKHYNYLVIDVNGDNLKGLACIRHTKYVDSITEPIRISILSKNTKITINIKNMKFLNVIKNPIINSRTEEFINFTLSEREILQQL